MYNYIDMLVAFRHGDGISREDGDPIDLASREGEHAGEDGRADEASSAGKD